MCGRVRLAALDSKRTSTIPTPTRRAMHRPLDLSSLGLIPGSLISRSGLRVIKPRKTKSYLHSLVPLRAAAV